MKTIIKAVSINKEQLFYRKMIFVVMFIILALLTAACNINTTSDQVTTTLPNVTDSTDKMEIEEKDLNSQMDETTKKNTTEKGDNMEEKISLLDANNNQYNLLDDLGNKVYIKFWATWCSICVAGLGDLSELSNQIDEEEGVEIITIVSPGYKGEMKTEDFVNWYKKQGYTFKVLLDEGGKVAQDFNIRAYPTSVFVSTDGETKETRMHVGGFF